MRIVKNSVETRESLSQQKFKFKAKNPKKWRMKNKINLIILAPKNYSMYRVLRELAGTRV
jgi:hypothetical protein